MADEECSKKLQSMQQYIPFLKVIIAQLRDPKKKNREEQLQEMESLYAMITDKTKKLKFETLVKCEDVIKKIQKKVTSPTSVITNQFQNRADFPPDMQKFICKDPPEQTTLSFERSRNEQLKFVASAKLHQVIGSPSPPKQIIEVKEQPVTIPLDKVSDDERRDWNSNSDLSRSNEHTRIERLDIYNSAVFNLDKSKVNHPKDSVFDRLGDKLDDMSKLPLSKEDRGLLQLSDTYTDNVTDESLDALKKNREKLYRELDENKDDDCSKLKNPTRQSTNSIKTTSVTVPTTSSTCINRPKTQRVEKVVKEPDTLFGNVLSSLDDILMEQQNKKKDQTKKCSGNVRDKKNEKDKKDHKRDSRNHKSGDKRHKDQISDSKSHKSDDKSTCKTDDRTHKSDSKHNKNEEKTYKIDNRCYKSDYKSHRSDDKSYRRDDRSHRSDETTHRGNGRYHQGDDKDRYKLFKDKEKCKLNAVENKKEDVMEDKIKSPLTNTITTRLRNRKNQVKDLNNDKVKTRQQTKASTKPKVRRYKSELNMLHDDIKDMFIRDGVLTAAGKSMCCILKESPDTLKTTTKKIETSVESNDEEDDVPLALRMNSSSDKSLFDSSLSRTSSLRVVLEKTDLQKLAALQQDSVTIEEVKAIEEKTEKIAEETKKLVAPKTPQEKKKKSTWSVGSIKKERKTNKTVKNYRSFIASSPVPGDDVSSFSSELEGAESEQSQQVSIVSEELKQNYHNKNYYFMRRKRLTCKLCSLQGKHITRHYKIVHQQEEMLISRLSPKEVKRVMEEAVKNPLPTISQMENLEINKKRHQYQCPFCNSFIRDNVDGYYDHLTSHTGEYRYHCVQCRFQTAIPKSLHTHLNAIHGESSINNKSLQPLRVVPATADGQVFGFLCRECHFVQTVRENVEEHIRSYHINVKDALVQIKLSKFPSKVDTKTRTNKNAEEIVTAVSEEEKINKEIPKEKESNTVDENIKNVEGKETEEEQSIKQEIVDLDIVKAEEKIGREEKDRNVFMSKTDILMENQRIEEERIEKMREINTKDDGTDKKFQNSEDSGFPFLIKSVKGGVEDNFQLPVISNVCSLAEMPFEDQEQTNESQPTITTPIIEQIPPLSPFITSSLLKAPTTSLVLTTTNPSSTVAKHQAHLLSSPLPHQQNLTSFPIPPSLTKTKQILLKDFPLTAEELRKPKKSVTATLTLLQQHHIGDLYKCPSYDCKFSTNVRTSFECHLKQHSDLTKIFVSCLYCNFKTEFDHVVIHVDVRHGNSRYACQYCFFRAFCESYVEIHQLEAHVGRPRKIISLPVHEDSKHSIGHIIKPNLKCIILPYKCGQNGCPATYLTKMEFINHLTTHCLSELTCSICSSKSPSATNLVEHYATLHGYCYYNCSYCKKGGNTHLAVYKHLTNCHFGSPPDIVCRIFATGSEIVAHSTVTDDDYQKLHHNKQEIRMSNSTERPFKLKGNLATKNIELVQSEFPIILNSYLSNCIRDEPLVNIVSSPNEGGGGINVGDLLSLDKLNETEIITSEEDYPLRLDNEPSTSHDDSTKDDIDAANAMPQIFVPSNFSFMDESGSQDADSLNTDHVKKHMKLHDQHLYKCGQCRFVHNLKHEVERHMTDKHVEKKSQIVVVREMETETEGGVSSASSLDKESLLSKEVKSWHCGICQYRSSTMEDVSGHAMNKHNIDTQYKCTLCKYKSDFKKHFVEHFADKHKNHDVDFIDVFYRYNAKKSKQENEHDVFDTTPLWQRDRLRTAEDKSKLSNIPSKSLIDKSAQLEDKNSSLAAEINTENECVEDPSVGLFGPFGSPLNNMYSCPLCSKFNTVFEVGVAHHLYQELEYYRYKCPTCSLTSITFTFMFDHLVKNHKDWNPKTIVELPKNPQIESWIKKVLEVQKSKMSNDRSEEAAKDFKESQNFVEYETVVTGDEDEEESAVNVVSEKELSEIFLRTPTDLIQSEKKALQQCPHCPYQCKAASDMRKHENRHWLQKPLKCGHCDYEGVTRSEITSHNKRAHKEPIVVALPMPKDPVIIPIIRKRKATSNGTDSCEAVSIKRTTFEVEEEETDKDKSSNDTVYVCKYCQKRLESIMEMYVHWENTHKAESYTLENKVINRSTIEKRLSIIKCDVCNYSGNVDTVHQHYLECHPEEKNYAQYKCSECGELFLKNYSLKGHFLVNHPLTPFVLSNCRRSDNRSDDGGVDNPNRPEKFKCGECGHTSNSYNVMNDHFRSHANPYKCFYCELRFNYPSLVQKHQQLTHANCDYKFETVDDFVKENAELRRKLLLVLNPEGEYELLSFTTKAKRSHSIDNSKDELLVVKKMVYTPCNKAVVPTVKQQQTARKSTTFVRQPEALNFKRNHCLDNYLGERQNDYNN